MTAMLGCQALLAGHQSFLSEEIGTEGETSSMKATSVSSDTERSALSRPLSHKASLTVVKGECCRTDKAWSDSKITGSDERGVYFLARALLKISRVILSTLLIVSQYALFSEEPWLLQSVIACCALTSFASMLSGGQSQSCQIASPAHGNLTGL